MSRRPLGDYVTPPEPSTASLHVEWHEVRRRVRRHRQVRVGAIAAASLLLLGAGLTVALREPTPSLLAGQSAEALEAPRKLTLKDGSVVQLSLGAAVGLELADESEVVLVLERGRASFDVSKRPTRRFVVKADSVEVRVIGTKFEVRREGRAVEVEVERGIVEVREGQARHRLVKGERWVRALAAAPETASIENTRETEVEVKREPEQAEVPSRRLPGRRAVNKPKEAIAEPAAPEPAVGPGPALEPVPVMPAEATPAEPTPAETFGAAMRARAAGRAKEAIAGFQQVCERWPSSAFAPMSAFEWGRLALDAQDDPRQAARAFERTLELATSSSLVEDALARLAEAYGRYDAAACRRVQSDYVRRFPSGPHVRGVTKACPP